MSGMGRLTGLFAVTVNDRPWWVIPRDCPCRSRVPRVGLVDFNSKPTVAEAYAECQARQALW